SVEIDGVGQTVIGVGIDRYRRPVEIQSSPEPVGPMINEKVRDPHPKALLIAERVRRAMAEHCEVSSAAATCRYEHTSLEFGGGACWVQSLPNPSAADVLVDGLLAVVFLDVGYVIASPAAAETRDIGRHTGISVIVKKLKPFQPTIGVAVK